MRLVSLSPAATEVLDALGLADRLVGVAATDPAPHDLPRVTRTAFDRAPATPAADVARQLRDAAADGAEVVTVDQDALEALAPDFVVGGAPGQCAPAHPNAFHFEGRTLAACLEDLDRLGTLLGETARTTTLRETLEARLEQACATTRPRAAILTLVWGDPPWAAGGIDAELVTRVGGSPRLSAPGAPPREVGGREIAEADADRLLIAPCGYDLDEAVAEARGIAERDEAQAVRAVREGEVWALAAPRSIVSRIAFAEAIASLLDGAPRGAINVTADRSRS